MGSKRGALHRVARSERSEPAALTEERSDGVVRIDRRSTAAHPTLGSPGKAGSQSHEVPASPGHDEGPGRTGAFVMCGEGGMWLRPAFSRSSLVARSARSSRTPGKATEVPAPPPTHAVRPPQGGPYMCGEGGIRTPEELAPLQHFQCCAFVRSATSPGPRAERAARIPPARNWAASDVDSVGRSAVGSDGVATPPATTRSPRRWHRRLGPLPAGFVRSPTRGSRPSARTAAQRHGSPHRWRWAPGLAVG